MAAALSVPTEVEAGNNFVITGSGWGATEAVAVTVAAEEGFGGIATTLHLTASGGNITTAGFADLVANMDGHVDVTAVGASSGTQKARIKITMVD